VDRYLGHLLVVAGAAIAFTLSAAIQPLALPQGPLGLGEALSRSAGAADAQLRAAVTESASGALDAPMAVLALLLHPMMLGLAPLVWLATDEERPAKTVLAAYAAFLILAVPMRLLLPVEVPRLRPWPFLAEMGDLVYPAQAGHLLPGLHAGLATCVALAARRSRHWRLRPLSFAYPFLVVPASLYFGVNGVLGVLTGVVFGVFAMVLAERATSVERIAHQRVDASPERKMEIRQAARALVEAVQEEARRQGLEVDVQLVGSVAKDTYLAHKVDIDCFALFPPDTPRRALEEQGLALGMAVLERTERRFAEHPYLAGTWEGLEAEVVPAYKVHDPAQRMSAVDRTPFHTAYVLRRLAGGQRREVRLLKQFLLGVGAYGAEAKVQGFSGYLAELLVLKYGSFRGVLRAGADWRVGQLLALEPFEGVPRFDEPLVVIDPVDAGRNVASAVSLENLLLFQEAARAYLQEPRLGFFFPRPVQPLPRERLAELLHRRGHAVLAFRLERPDVLDDSLHAQLRKCAAALAQALERGGWAVHGAHTFADARRAHVLLELQSLAINEREVHAGPPADAGEHAERFRAKWTGNERALSAVYEEQGRLMVTRRREFTNAAEFLRAKALELDLGRDLTAAGQGKGFEVLEQDAALRELDARELTRFVQRARPWER
jgi:tRNA nucleotidyltransferase (CCA-adding enzyme)